MTCWRSMPITALPPAAEAALLKFVRDGHGLVAIHCASACFGNSAEYRRLIGGRFLKHAVRRLSARDRGSGERADEGACPPSKRGMRPMCTIRSIPTSTSCEKRDDEPWTWIRTEGAGRVFYTASGHDERVWSQPAFQELIERAIRWAAGPKAVAELAALNLQPLEYYDGPPVQNYERRVPPPRAQRPLTTAEAAKHFHVPVEMNLSLVASEPDLWKMLDIKFDERGRMWTCETRDFPERPEEAGRGRRPHPHLGKHEARRQL